MSFLCSNRLLPEHKPTNQRECAGAGYLVADAVSMHEGLGRHDRLLSATSLLLYPNLLSQLRGDLGNRGAGLTGTIRG